MKRSTKMAPVSLSTSYFTGSAFIGISMITLNASGTCLPGVTWSRDMEFSCRESVKSGLTLILLSPPLHPARDVNPSLFRLYSPQVGQSGFPGVESQEEATQRWCRLRGTSSQRRHSTGETCMTGNSALVL